MTITNAKLVAIIKAIGGAEFTESDWHGFSGCNSDNPHIASVGSLTIIADGNDLVINDGEDETYLRLVCTL